MKKLICLLTAVMMLTSLAACSGADAAPTQPTGSDGFTLSNSILGEDYTFTYDAVPRRIVSLASPANGHLLRESIPHGGLYGHLDSGKICTNRKTRRNPL